MIRVLITDDHHMVRRGLALFLGTQPDILIVGEAANGAEAIALVQKLQPHIVLMDLVMPGMDGVEATKQMKAQYPSVKVMILTSFSDPEHVLPALEAGASGYQLKDIEPDELARCIRSICGGTNEIHPKATTHLVTNLHSMRQAEYCLHTLTKREREVLKEIAAGKSNKEIADALVITERTVKTHVSSVLAKLSLSDRTQAALFAVRNKLV